METRRNYGKILRYAGLGLIILLFIFRSILGHIGSGVLEDRLELLNGDRDFLTAEGFAEEKVPDSENAAPVYRTVFEALSNPKIRDNIAALSAFAAAGDGPIDPKLRQKARRSTVRLKGITALLEKAAARPVCRFPVKWDDDSLSLEDYTRFRKAMRIIAGNARLAAEDGNVGEAVRLTALELKISNSLRTEPSLTAHMVMVFGITGACGNVRQVVRCGKLSESQAERLQKALSNIDLNKAHYRAMQGERAAALWTFDQIRKHPSQIMYTRRGVRHMLVLTIPGWFIGRLWMPMVNFDEIAYLDKSNRYTEAARFSYREACSKQYLPSADSVPAYAFVTRSALPNCPRATLRRDSGIADINGTRIFLALQIYRKRFASYPDTLMQLRNRIGWKLPGDPLSGKDFIYRRQGEGFVLYSVGMNMRDDGGERKPEPTAETDPDDIMWKAAM